MSEPVVGETVAFWPLPMMAGPSPFDAEVLWFDDEYVLIVEVGADYPPFMITRQNFRDRTGTHPEPPKIGWIYLYEGRDGWGAQSGLEWGEPPETEPRAGHDYLAEFTITKITPCPPKPPPVNEVRSDT